MLINRYASSFFTVSKSFRAFSTNQHSLFKKQALEELLPFKRIFRSNQNLIHNAILPKQCFLRDVFREVKQSTDITNSLSILSQLQADDVEVGSLLAFPNNNKPLKGVNLLLSRLQSTRSDLNYLIKDSNNKHKTYSFLVSLPRKDPIRYLPEVIDFVERGKKENVIFRPAFFMSADSDYSLKNQNMTPDEAIKLHDQAFSYLYKNSHKKILQNSILYVSMPQSDLVKLAMIMKDFPGIVSFGDTNGMLEVTDLVRVLKCALSNNISENQWSLHLHGNPNLTLDQDVFRIVKLMVTFFKLGGKCVDGNAVPLGFKNQLTGISSKNERSGNLSFRFLFKLLVSLNIGGFDKNVDSYAHILKLQKNNKCVDLFHNVDPAIIEKGIQKSLME